MTNDYPTVSEDPVVQAFYVRCRQCGESHNVADMLAQQQPPMSDSDKEFLEGRGGCYDQFPGPMAPVGERYRKMAEEAGVSTTGKVYLGGLAQYPGDVRAWVSDKSDVKRVCEEQGMSCEGAVKVKAPADAAPSPGVGIADDLIEEVVLEKMEADPSLVPSEKLWQDTRDEIKPTWADKIEKPA